MKKIKTLMPVLLATSTAAATVGFVASCSQASGNVRMNDVESLFTNGWKRTTKIYQGPSLAHDTDLSNWYLNKVVQNKEILRDDAMLDAFPKPEGLQNTDYHAKGSIGLEIGNIIINPTNKNYRLDFTLGFNGTATELEVPKIPGVIDGGYLTGNLSVEIKVVKMLAKVERAGLFCIHADYFKNNQGAPYAEVSLDKLKADDEWKVTMHVKWNGGISQTKGVPPESEDHPAQDYTFDKQWIEDKCQEGQETVQLLANLILPHTWRVLDYMKNVRILND